jgi:hypothetical protein
MPLPLTHKMTSDGGNSLFTSSGGRPVVVGISDFEKVANKQIEAAQKEAEQHSLKPIQAMASRKDEKQWKLGSQTNCDSCGKPDARLKCSQCHESFYWSGSSVEIPPSLSPSLRTPPTHTHFHFLFPVP